MNKQVSKEHSLLIAACLFLLSINASFAKQIAITFDDAPLVGNKNMSGLQKTHQIIAHLTDNQVDDALFFVTTGNINSNTDRQRLAAYANAGFHLAHHSHSHLSANKNSVVKYLEDFDKANSILESFKGVLKYHRFPFLHYGETAKKRTAIHAHLAKHNYKIGYVTVDNYDWYINSKFLAAQKAGLNINYDNLGQLYVETLWAGIQFYDDLAKEHLKRSPKHVLLLHENELAALYLGKMIEHIRSQGWEIISPQEAFDDPISSAYKPAQFHFNKQGRVAAILDSQGVEKRKLRHPSENTEFIDKLFSIYQVTKNTD
ncbi:polysaccharide deacetylase family protein [Thalassotalea sp. M1531]|uniref:Polysaccharide deacetylase family protein n=1 Tax=Thalassotalea algicola TaxID=2716224 RepID=A0A7Y0Q6F3_9GAMM|nr:polysaccharide deacetylase family protein [Thalassotalea algicola]NMP31116.1 polysaccharide deacetylase family protein [Thalassotalea algicola]